MSAVDAFREEHAELLGHIDGFRTLAARLPRMSPAEREAELRPIVAFLRQSLVPHAEAEEHVLYPAVASALGSPEATATMISDHRAIVSRIEALAAAPPDDLDQLQELLYGLHALLLVHFRKEEDDYLPLLEKRPPEEVEAVFRQMSEHAH
ncbi:MAG TPA: hemerythrin domain-containing protein [Solirubrobacterales bacterium]|nr:hemerythrin domain-containing protein [Solirubrobacterales bacterium]